MADLCKDYQGFVERGAVSVSRAGLPDKDAIVLKIGEYMLIVPEEEWRSIIKIAGGMMSESLEEAVRRVRRNWGNGPNGDRAERIVRSIDQQRISSRLVNCLVCQGFDSFFECEKMTEQEWKEMANFGKVCLAEMKRLLASYGRSLTY